jgi:FG-GAP-like repeat/Tachylectin
MNTPLSSRSALRRLVALSGAAVAIAAASVTMAGTAHAAPTTSATNASVADTSLTAASSVGGQIARSEIIARAVYWNNRGDTWYSQQQSDAISDGTGGSYRPDCSGFVSMAWHLPKKTDGWDFNVRDFANGPSPSAPGYAGMSRISLDSLLAGDAIVEDSLGHIELFDKWVDPSDHHQGMWLYGEHDFGRKTEHNTRSWSDVSGNFFGIRYDNAVTTAGNGTNAVANGDVNGDGRSDLVARKPDGTLYLYANTGSNTAPYTAGAKIGSSWEQFNWFLLGDVTGDKRADIVAEHPDGTLSLYANSGSDTTPFTSGAQIGSAWQQFSNITLADVTGDGRADLVAKKSDGALMLYANSGSTTSPYGNGTQIGSGWGAFSTVAASDVTGDGRADLTGVRSDGSLWLYANSGSTTAPYTSGTQIGSGWQGFNRVTTADVTGDARADIVATKADGTLWLYANSGSNTAPYGSGAQIGSGWQGFA